MHRMEIIELAAFYRPPLYASNQLFHQLFAVLDAVAGMIEIVLDQRHKQQIGEGVLGRAGGDGRAAVWGSSAMV